MQQPEHVRPFQAVQNTPRRFFSLGFVILFHIFVIYAFASGLAQHLVSKLPEEFKAEVVKEVIPVKPPPPPPPPDLVKPPPPFVPPPEISIQTEAPPTNTISVSNVKPPPPEVKATGITAPASIGSPHNCPQDRWYPPIALRLNQEGSTTIKFTIGADGSVSNVAVSESSGHDSLDEAAMRCASSWHYRPAMREGQAIEVPWQTVIKWQIR